MPKIIPQPGVKNKTSAGIVSLNLLRGEHHVRTDSYMFNTPHGYAIEITFENFKFKQCRFPFSGIYTRDEWMVLADVYSKICEIESRHNKELIRAPFPDPQ